MYSACLCSKKRSMFTPYISYKNEAVFKDYEGIIIGKCKKCRLLKTFTPENMSFNPKQSRNNMYESQRSYFVKLFSPIVKKIKQYKSSGNVLDVGCSSGILLELLKKENYDVFGIEPNKQSFNLARKKFGKRIFHGILTQLYYSVLIRSSKQKFDVVIYNHVLEHIEDVQLELKLVKRILKKDGIFVLGLPNIDNCIFFLRKKYWEPLMPLEHIWHFSKKIINDFLKNNKFKILDITFSNDDRKDYPFMKKLYFQILSSINGILHTGEAMLLISKKIE